MQIGPGITFGPNITINPPAVAAPPNYTTSGLVLYLDAGNINSFDFDSNSSAWFDLSGTGNHANVRLLTSATAGGVMGDYYSYNYVGEELVYAGNYFAESGIAKVEPSSTLRSNTGFTWEILVFSNPGSARKVWLNMGGATGVRLGAKRSFTGDFNGTGNFIELSVNQQTTSNVYYTGIPELTFDSNTGWAHIVGTYDKTDLKLYVNTNLSTTAASNSNINYVGAFPLWIGGINISNPASYPGTNFGGGDARTTDDSLAVVRMYNRALNSTEVTNNFNQLAARYPMSTTLTL